MYKYKYLKAKFWCFWLCNLNRKRRKEEEKTSRSDQKLLQISAIQTHEDTKICTGNTVRSDECIYHIIIMLPLRYYTMDKVLF